LDNRILDLAKDSDVDVIEGLNFVSFEEDINKTILVKFKNEDEEFIYSTKLLIGADGANSRIRKQLNLKPNSDWHRAIAIRAYIDSPNYIEIFKERTLMFEINVSAEKGYAWAFPSKGSLLNIGIGVPVSIFKKDKLNINKLLEDFIDQLESRGVIVENVRKQKSYMLPFASSRPKLIKNINVALIGDASSMINPMSGEGIFYGMEAGYLIAKNTNNLINSDKLASGILKYEKEFSRRFRKHYLSCALARLILQSPFMTKRLLKVAANDQDTIDFVVELLFDEAYLTLIEVFKITYKFLIPTRLLAFTSKK
jgi:flavin-dependent dehydrogenase